MIESFLAFLALAFLGDEQGPVHREEDEREALRDRVIREVFPGGVSEGALWTRTWEAAFEVLRRFDDEPNIELQWLEGFFAYRVGEAGPLLERVSQILGTPFQASTFLRSLSNPVTWTKEQERQVHEALVLHDRLVSEGRMPKTYPFPLPLPPGLEWSYFYDWQGTRMDRRPSIEWEKGVGGIVANPYAARWAGYLLTCRLRHRSDLFHVWTARDDWSEAIEEAAGAARALGFDGLFTDPEYPEGVTYEDDPEAFEEAQADLMYTESGWISADEWGISSLEDPFRPGGSRWVRSMVSDFEDPHIQKWVALKIRSAPGADD